MEIKPCRDCLYYDDCIKNSEDPNHPPALKERLNIIFIDGYDCFVRINRDLEY